MIIRVADVLAADEVAEVLRHLAGARFAEGSATAGWHARDIKKNLQLTRGMEGHEPAERIVATALARNAIFQMAVRPRHHTPVIFNRYEPGMTYGAHIDDATMAFPGRMPDRIRTDMSYTLFLSDPASYRGGELVVGADGIEHGIKLPQGALVAYPATALHQVAPVSEGSRIAAIGWVQSEVRDAAKRTILFDLDMVRRKLFAQEGKSQSFDLLSKSHANLLRLWADT